MFQDQEVRAKQNPASSFFPGKTINESEETQHGIYGKRSSRGAD